MRLNDYERLIKDGSKQSIITLLQTLINEYYHYAVRLGYIDSNNVKKFNDYINNLQVVIDPSLGGDAMVEGSVIHINPRKMFRTDINLIESEKNATEILFHELSHVMNSFHDDYLAGDEGTLDIFCDKFHALAYQKFGMYIEKNDDNSNPSNLDKYCYYGIRLLDEVVAQDVAETFMAEKYGYDRRRMFKGKSFLGINYRTNFNYYGLFQEIAERFSRTLAGVSSLSELSKLSFHEDVPYKIVSEHIEKSSAFKCLYEELCYMGLILYSYYLSEGHGRNGAVMPNPDFIKDGYDRLLRLLNLGYENRTEIHTPKVVVDTNEKTLKWQN